MTKPKASAVTKVDWGGSNAKAEVDFDTLFPSKVTVTKGSTVTFNILGFHTVVIPKKGDKLPPLVLPTATMNPVTKDPAGVPYWWSGTTPQLGFNPAAATPSGGKVVNGKKTVNSGLPQGKHPTFSVRFDKLGTYQVRCAVHPRMRGTIRVVANSTDTAAKQKARATKEKAALLKTVTALVEKAKAATGPAVTIAPGTASVQAMQFYPSNVKVAPGSTVTFTMSGRNEIHTVSFGPEAYLTQVSKAGFGGLTIGSEAAYPSDPPAAGVASVTPTAHGNGFVNSGILADPGSGIPGPNSVTFKFPTAGTYAYMCLVHNNMHGTITVG